MINSIKSTHELQYKDLQASMLFTANQDVRFYLMGVYVGKGVVAATNGHALILCDEPEAKDLDLIIPKYIIKSLCTKVGKKPNIQTVLLHDVGGGFWLLQHAGSDSYELFKPIDGKFPDIKRVDIPKPEKYTAESFPDFDFDYLNLFLKACRVYNGYSHPKLFPTTENDRCYVEIDDRVHGVLMPRRK